MSHQKIIIVIDENDKIIEQIDITGTNFTDASRIEKETRKKYQGRKVQVKIGYKGVSDELFNKTKSLLEDINKKYPEIFSEIYVKDRPEFRHLGYNMNKIKKRKVD